jgi:hypothetical protein
VFAGSVICLLVLALMHFEAAGDAWLLLVGIHIAALAIPLEMRPVRLVTRSDKNSSFVGAVRPRQFSLRQAFLATSIIAVLLALLRTAVFTPGEVLLFFSFGLLYAAIGWMSVWMVYGRAKDRWRLSVAGAATLVFGAAGLLCWLAPGRRLDYLAGHVWFNLLHWLMLSGSLLVLRIAGYRRQDLNPATETQVTERTRKTATTLET